MSIDSKNTHFRSYTYIGYKHGKDAKTVCNELQLAFLGDYSPCLRTIYGWFEDIRRGNFTLEKGHSTGRPRSGRRPVLIRKVKRVVEKDPRISIRQLANDAGISVSTTYRILTEELNLKCYCSVWVPTTLSEQNKKDRIQCCKRLIKFLSGQISDVYCVQDELWINWDLKKSKNQNKAWLKKGQKRLQVPKPKLTPRKLMLLIAFTTSPARFSITVLPKGKTIDAECFVQFLKDTNKRFSSLKQNKTTLKKLTLQFDNARHHSAGRTQEYLRSSNITTMKQSPYIPDLNQCDRFLFTRLQEHCRGQEYADSHELQYDVQRFLRQLPESLLFHELDKLKSTCEAIIRESGSYITTRLC